MSAFRGEADMRRGVASTALVADDLVVREEFKSY